MISVIPYNFIRRVNTKNLGKSRFEAKKGVYQTKNQSTIDLKNLKWFALASTIDADDSSENTKIVSKSADEDTVKDYLDCV